MTCHVQILVNLTQIRNCEYALYDHNEQQRVRERL